MGRCRFAHTSPSAISGLSGELPAGRRIQLTASIRRQRRHPFRVCAGYPTANLDPIASRPGATRPKPAATGGQPVAVVAADLAKVHALASDRRQRVRQAPLSTLALR